MSDNRPSLHARRRASKTSPSGGTLCPCSSAKQLHKRAGKDSKLSVSRRVSAQPRKALKNKAGGLETKQDITGMFRCERSEKLMPMVGAGVSRFF